MTVQDSVDLGGHRFSMADQLEFARFSGDFNPIHVDPVQARKTIAGQCIVHGIAGFLFALNLLAKQFSVTPRSVKIRFINAIKLDTEVRCLWNEDENVLKVVGEKKITHIDISYGKVLKEVSKQSDFVLGELTQLGNPKNPAFENFSEGEIYQSLFGGKITSGAALYPDLVARLGLNTVYEIGLLSNIIGMQIPGLHSIFMECKIALEDGSGDHQPSYKIVRIDERFNLLTLGYHGKNITGLLTALRRPSFESKTCDDIKEMLPDSNFLSGRKVLVIGGSRGIGAAFARVAGLLGAEVTITYRHGKEDAEEVRADISAYSDTDVNAIQLDVTEDVEIEELRTQFDDLCYFATPRIFGKIAPEFDSDRFDMFYAVYCKSFEKIARVFLENGGTAIYYPSSVAVEDDVKGLEEYKLAKMVGEKICNSLAKEYGCKVVVDRLDRIETDQTLTVARSLADDAATVAIKIARKLS